MKTEIEAKFLNIDVANIRAKLQALGAMLIHPESLTTQKVFDYPDFRLDNHMSWLRLREENNIVTLTFKKWEQEGLHGMKETEIKVDSFDEVERILFAIGMIIKSTQTKKRELWRIGATEFMIDTWPWIPPFLEIEGQSEGDVRTAAAQLGLQWEKALFGGVSRIYKEYFDVEYEQIDRCPEIIFSPTPTWLEAKKIFGRQSESENPLSKFIGINISITIDRPLGSQHPKWKFAYPVNYGFIPNTKSADGEELDAYVLGVDKPLTEFTGRCIAIIHRLNDDDDKLVLVPDDKNFTDDEIRAATHFQEQFFASVIVR